MAPVLLELAPHWRWAVRIQGRFEQTLADQLFATALAVGGFLVSLGVIYGARRVLEDRINNDAIRAAQGLILSAVALVLTGFLVAVWRLTSQVERAVAEAFGPLVSGEVAIKALVAFIALAVGYTITRLTKQSIKYGAASNRITPHQRQVAHHITQIIVFLPILGFIVALWGIPFQSLFLGAGVLGVVIGFAARQTLSGALSGFVLLFGRPFEVGDWIRINDREGIVTDISLYNTQIRTFDEEHVLVPNETVTGSEVINYSKTDRLRLERDVGVDYDCDVGEAARVAIDAMEACEPVADTPRPDVIRQRFGDSSVVLRLRYWIDSPNIQRKWQAQNAVVESVKTAFEAEGIKIPFPQQELMGRNEEGGLRVVDSVPEAGESAGEHRTRNEIAEPVEDEHGNATETDGGSEE